MNVKLIEWPKQKRKALYDYLTPLLSFSFWKRLIVIALLLVVYIGIVVFGPSILPNTSILMIRENLWWPLDIIFLIGTGGAILKPGVASVGLLGGLYFLSGTHKRVRNGMQPWRAVILFYNAVLTLLICSLVTFLSFYHLVDLGAVQMFGFFVIIFAGSLVIQYVNAELFHRSGASAITVNIILALSFITNELKISSQDLVIILLVSILAILTIYYYRLLPFKVPIETGLPPRITVLERFPSIDFKVLHLLGVFNFSVIVVFDLVWNAFSSGREAYSPAYLVTVLSLVVIASYFFYRINLKGGFYKEIDPTNISKNLIRNFITIQDVKPGTESYEYLFSLLKKAQLRGLMVYAGLLFGICIMFLSGTSGSNLQISTIYWIITLPLVVSVVARHFFSFYLTVRNTYSLSRQTNYSPSELDVSTQSYIPDEYSFTGDLTDEKQMENLLRDVFLYFEERGNDDIVNYLREQGALDNPTKKELIKILMATIFSRIPSTETTKKSLTWKIAIKELKDFGVRFITTILTVLIVTAILESLIELLAGDIITVENFILLNLGIVIPMVILDVVKDPKAFKFILKNIWERIKKLFSYLKD